MKKLIFIINILIFFEIMPMLRLNFDEKIFETLAISSAANYTVSEQEQKVIDSLSKDLNLSKERIISLGLYQPLQLEGCSASSPQEATCQLQQLFNEVNDTKWRVFRQQAACLINLGASVNIISIGALLNITILYQDYPFVEILLKHGAKPDKNSLKKAHSVLMAKLLTKHGANPLTSDWSNIFYGDPLDLGLNYDRQPELLEFYIKEYGYNPILFKKWVANGIKSNHNLLHMLLNRFSWNSKDFKKKAFILLKYGVNPYEKNAEGDSAIDIAQKKEPEIRDAFNEAINEYKEYKNELKEILIETKDLDSDVAEHLIGYILPQSKKD